MSKNWKKLAEFPGYEINELGQVRNATTQKLLTPFQGTSIVLPKGKERKPTCRSINKLVYVTFVGKPPKGRRILRSDETKAPTAKNLRVAGDK